MPFPSLMLLLTIVGAGAATSGASAAVRCEDLRDEHLETQTLPAKKPVNKSNWYDFDVLVQFDRARCLKSLKQALFEVNGEKLWEFATTEDECDGGNVYGAIYSYDLKTPIAHLYDGAITCEADWREDYRAKPRQ